MSHILRTDMKQDWVTMLRNAKTKIESLKVYETSIAADEVGALSTKNPTASLPVKLLKDLFILSKNQDALKVLNNISIAALHLACMLRGTANSDDHLVIRFFAQGSYTHQIQLGRSEPTF